MRKFTKAEIVSELKAFQTHIKTLEKGWRDSSSECGDIEKEFCYIEKANSYKYVLQLITKHFRPLV